MIKVKKSPLVHVDLFTYHYGLKILAKSSKNGPVIIEAGGETYDICYDVAAVVWIR